MSSIDPNREFIPVRIAILTVSDTRTAADDRSGDTLAARATDAGHEVKARAIVTDDREMIAVQLGTAIFDPDRETVYRWVAYAIIAGSALSGLPVWD